jgi:prolyl-tRNA synthetase
MRFSSYFLPILKENPQNAHIASHRLMLRAGLVHQTTSGIYSWLPFGQRVLSKLETLIEEEQNRIGCHRIIMPTIQPAHLWQESGRYEDYGREMLRMQDRHDRPMLYGPTHEEVITDIARSYLTSYRQLPQVWYQIHWKFRDEIRPRFGVMRGREFLMKDGYSFDLTVEAAQATYRRVFQSYMKTFRRMGLEVIPVQADTGPIGGDLSYEFHVLADTGESALYYDQAFQDLKPHEDTFEHLTSLYAMADEKHLPDFCPLEPDRLLTRRGIEVGHIFYFGQKYSRPMNFSVMGENSAIIYPEMGSYGMGVTRLVGAIIEAHHDDQGIIWPESIAPFQIGLILVKTGDSCLVNKTQTLYQKLTELGLSVLYDDREERAGFKFATMDLIGLPWQVIVGEKTSTEGLFELKCRRTQERNFFSQDQLLTFLKNRFDKHPPIPE